MKKKNTLLGNLLLLTAAIIWGSAFVAQGQGAEYVGSFTFNGLRFLIGGIALIPAITVSTLKKQKAGTYAPMTRSDRLFLLMGGIFCGIALAVASYLQQGGLGGIDGIEATSPGKAGFITALYILIVPIIGLFFKKKTPLAFWGCIAIAIVGFYFLCIDGSLALQSGDALVLASSLCYSVHIILIDHFSEKCDGIMLSCAQFFTVGIICTVFMLIFEKPDLDSISNALFSIVYTGIFSCGVGYTFQVLGQQRTYPAMATLLMSLESVFALVTGIIFDFSNNVPSLKEAIGSVLIFASVIAAQMLPQPVKSKTDKNLTENEK